MNNYNYDERNSSGRVLDEISSGTDKDLMIAGAAILAASIIVIMVLICRSSSQEVYQLIFTKDKGALLYFVLFTGITVLSYGLFLYDYWAGLYCSAIGLPVAGTILVIVYIFGNHLADHDNWSNYLAGKKFKVANFFHDLGTPVSSAVFLFVAQILLVVVHVYPIAAEVPVDKSNEHENFLEGFTASRNFLIGSVVQLAELYIRGIPRLLEEMQFWSDVSHAQQQKTEYVYVIGGVENRFPPTINVWLRFAFEIVANVASYLLVVALIPIYLAQSDMDVIMNLVVVYFLTNFNALKTVHEEMIIVKRFTADRNDDGKQYDLDA